MKHLRATNRLHPFTTLGWLQDEINRASQTAGRAAAAWSPPFTLHETDTAFEVRFEVPGADVAQLDVAVEGSVLRVSGERAGFPDAARRRLTRERSTGKFSRTLDLSAPVDSEHVRAQYRKGILHVSLPKAAGARAHNIAIRLDDEE